MTIENQPSEIIFPANDEFESLFSLLKKHNLNISENPRGTDKGDFKCYVDEFYEKEFAPIKNNKNRFLEIGVRSGASLALWANYFKNIEIIGLDI